MRHEYFTMHHEILQCLTNISRCIMSITKHNVYVNLTKFIKMGTHRKHIKHALKALMLVMAILLQRGFTLLLLQSL